MSKIDLVLKKLFNIQQKLTVEKTTATQGIKYSFFDIESILKALNPLLSENKLFLSFSIDTYTEKISETEPNRVYVRAKATIYDIESEQTFESYGIAKDPRTQAGANESQTTMSATTYAKKSALISMLAINTGEEPERTDYIYKCKVCGNAIKGPKPPQELAKLTGGLCKECYDKERKING